MTVSPDAAPLLVESFDEAAAALRERGLRLSTSRRLVLEALFASDGPLSAERVARALNLEAASVHRNFETLERHGLVRHVHLGHGPGLYALRRAGERVYLYCDCCGAVTALAAKELDPLRKRIRERYGYEARFDHFAIVGTCAACSGQTPREAVPRSATRGERAAMGEHGHAHSHGHYIHAHPHVHREGLEDRHEHGH